MSVYVGPICCSSTRPIFLGDEIGTLRYLKQTPTYILTHFRPLLTMNYFILFEKESPRFVGQQIGD